MASIILPPGTAPASPSEGELYYDNTAKQVKFRDNSGFKALGTADLQGEPHIITKKLFPAYLGKLLDGTTSHSGNYGTEQSDGRMYYYTDIAGSKPIHDPRIGAHFGSQRYKTRSLQYLEQETAAHGKNVYSIDGREYLRAASSGGTVSHGDWYVLYDNKGTYIQNNVTPGAFIEIVAYGNHLNMSYIWTANASHSVNRFDVYVDGVLKHDSPASALATVDRPGMTRYVNGASVLNLVDEADNVSCGLHTFKMLVAPEHQGSPYSSVSDIEIIAQDTTSSSTKVQIQVPAQDVVSYGRKFSVSATAQHYDPFNGFSSGNATALATKVDTATSLGLSKWLHSSTYYRPYNGMRVVKWIDENGAIKTSVTCMPPNAKSVADSSTLTNANAKANASIANNTFYPTFEAHTTSVNEDNLHEVAKTFLFREFGNGSANGGTGATWADASQLEGTTADDISFCMDDGTTNLVAKNGFVNANFSLGVDGNSNSESYITFIGTGIGYRAPDASGSYNSLNDDIVAQNLPYGTHLIRNGRNSGSALNNVDVDGIEVKDDNSAIQGIQYIDIFQPKKPPIPDSACVLADYMVFADFKPQTTAGIKFISKGVRRQNLSRDVFADETDGDSFSLGFGAGYSEGFNIALSGNADSDTSMKLRIPSFGTNYVHRGYQSDSRTKLFIGDTDNDSGATKDNTASYGSYAHLTSDLTLGAYNFGSNAVSGTNGNTTGFDIVTPTHTSHHYQPFETPYLYELIGGDRSMEQTNLICSSDGKSWDEVTRDTRYIGSMIVSVNTDTETQNGTGASNTVKFDDIRGNTETYRPYFTKDFTIAYDRLICLKDGQYNFSCVNYNSDATHTYLYLNNNYMVTSYNDGSSPSNNSFSFDLHVKRGDYVQIRGGYGTDSVVYNSFQIKRI
jgi:hypothetical protein